MAKNEEWFIYIQDRDRMQFSLAGPVNSVAVSDWIEVVIQEQERGRQLSCQEVTAQDLAECRAHAKGQGYSEIECAEMITPPRDRSNDYAGTLPSYATKADRAKLVQLLCKGRCRKSRLAELNKPYPGRDILRQAAFGEFIATCLYCGSIAKDNYNWHR